MFYVIQSTITHQLALVKFSIFVKFQEYVLPYVNPVSIFVDHFLLRYHGNDNVSWSSYEVIVISDNDMKPNS